MKLHEYQAKELLSQFGVSTLPGYLAYSQKEAQKAAVDLGGKTVVIKAQVHAGGRGKAGGVKVAQNPNEAFKIAGDILGMTLVTPQTGEEGKLVRKLWVEQGAQIEQEFYLSLLVDRKHACISIIASAEGGTEIEELAQSNPEALLHVQIANEVGLMPFHQRLIFDFFQTPKADQRELGKMLSSLYSAFLALDCELLEVNPLVKTVDGRYICLDAKVSVDDNAAYRQPKAKRMIDYDEIDSREIRATECGLSYIPLHGNIGCMVNGAGLAMATMDLIKQAGGEPANFLDVGGGASQEMVAEAFKIILEDDAVEAVLVNIFGGIMRCDVIAEGVLAAAKQLSVDVPLVVRLAGTNVDIGKKLLDESELNIISANDMGDAARKVVAAAKSSS
jgi:succinyl-CoA synthetase beta subunit